jgi:two-component system, NarL family, sensor kinase
MENWKESKTLFVWIVYILFISLLILFFVIYLIRKNLNEQTRRKKELSLLKEKHLKELITKHIQTQEYERERIGSDLHDAISNKLNMILLKLRVSDTKNDIEEDINNVINSVRRIAHDMNPPMIETIPVDVLVLSQFDRLEPNYEVKKWSNQFNRMVWSTERKIQIVRIVQEIASNIVKHSKATTVEVKLRERNQQLWIAVEDDGVGFLANFKGMGVQNIENRIFIINGTFKIKSAPQRGTRIIIVLNNGI